ncbi:MAG TPA: zf-HC2 domain-containing protein [Planctomycetota bacterium]|nr:zf-HC2 domain-containing protein [Planctomycetota bacterium]
MNCPDLKPVLIEYLDGRLTADRAAEASSHLAACTGCRRAAEAYRGTWELLGRLEPLEPDSAFLAQVHRRTRGSWIPRVVAALGAAAALLVAILVYKGESPGAVESAIEKLSAEDRGLLEELARDQTWELADNMEVIRTYELLDRESSGALPPEDH